MRAAANVDIAFEGPSKNVSAQWSASNLNLQPYKKTWNYFTENINTRASFSICAYFVSNLDKVLDAKATGLSVLLGSTFSKTTLTP